MTGIRPFESPWLYGLHDRGGKRLMQDAGRPGWIVLSFAIGHDPADRSGEDLRDVADQGFGVICRLNNGYYPDGTLPSRGFYADFARRCGNFVAASEGCHVWVIGNEPNFTVERPHPSMRALGVGETPAVIPEARTSSAGWFRRLTAYLGAKGPTASSHAVSLGETRARGQSSLSAQADPWLHAVPERFSALYAGAAPHDGTQPGLGADGEPILPEAYAECYRLCRRAIHDQPGHADDLVLVAAVAPWNNQTSYPANPTGDWVRYFADVLTSLTRDECDGFALHAYTHHADPRLVSSEAKMQPPFVRHHYEFRVYRDFLAAVPADMRHLPAYMTETNQDIPWLDDETGWIEAVYCEIDEWNRGTEAQRIRAVALYRWSDGDRWGMESKPNVVADFAAALKTPRRWWPLPPLHLTATDRLRMEAHVNVRRTPGHVGKPADDVVILLPAGTVAQLVSREHQSVDDLTWWHVGVTQPVELSVQGWIAQTDPAGQPLFVVIDSDSPPAPFSRGDTVETTTIVNMRRTPGYVGKPDGDVTAELPVGERLRVVNGPQVADAVAWWRCRHWSASGTGDYGWVAQTAPDGQLLLQRVDPDREPPDEGDRPQPKFHRGDRAETLTYARLRRSPGYNDKPDDDVVADIAAGTPVNIEAGPKYADDLTWWTVATTSAAGDAVRGWMAESAPDRIPMLGKQWEGALPVFQSGEVITVSLVPVRSRRSPGNRGKPDDDVLGEYPIDMSLYVLDGPVDRDGSPWWKVSGIGLFGELVGWVAQRTDGGVVLVQPPRPLPGTGIPAAGNFLPMPFIGTFGIAQLWGENRAFYEQFSYDGVPLRGHNGIDFLTPTGTPVAAVADGIVIMVGNEVQGFGLFVLAEHSWGQSIYAHLDRVDVELGQRIVRQQLIGLSGSSGRSTGPHLHFAIRINPYDRADGWGGFSDPLPYWDPEQIILPAYMFENLDNVPGHQRPDLMAHTRLEPSGMVVEVPGMVRP